MEMLNITRNGVPTLAAVLNFCLYPQGFFPQLGITAIVVPGTEIGDVDQIPHGLSTTSESAVPLRKWWRKH